MARQLLLELITDVDRLVTAGALSGAGHERLRRHADALTRLGERVPALRALVPFIEAVLTAAEGEAAVALLELLARTRHLRATLAEPEKLAGELEPAPDSGPWATDADVGELVRELNRLTVSDAHPRRVGAGKDPAPPADLRLIGALLDRLKAKHPYTADAVADHVLAVFGPALAAELTREPFDAADVESLRRLVALCGLDPDAAERAILDLCPESKPYL